MVKKIFLRSVVLASLFLSTMVFIGCEKKSLDESNVSAELSQEEKVVVEQLFPFTGDNFLAPGEEKKETFNSLSDKQLDYFLDLLAENIAGNSPEGWPEEGLSHQDVVLYFHSFFHALDQLAVQLSNKRYNQLSEEELGSLIGNNAIMLNDLQAKMDISDNLFRLLDRDQKRWIVTEMKSANENDASIEKSMTQRGTSCPKYYYGIKTYRAESGSRSCRGYRDATNLADDDCDWEFIFDWPYNHSPSYPLGLYSTGLRTGFILRLGGINGRVDASDNSVRFLIGRNRIKRLLLEPEDIQQDLKGNW